MAHRFLHTLVFSSALALDGCSNSHPLLTEPPDGGMPDGVGFDSTLGFDSAAVRDGGPASVDAGSARFDTGPSVDAGPPPFDGGAVNGDAGADAGSDAGSPLDMRLCEPGWQTTKASTCRPLDMDDPDSLLICYGSIVCEPVMNDAGELTTECRPWEEGDGGCLLPAGE